MLPEPPTPISDPKLARPHINCFLWACVQAIPPVLIESTPTDQVYVIKYLGVVISSHLSWSNHIKKISSKDRKVAGLIYKKVSKNIQRYCT